VDIVSNLQNIQKALTKRICKQLLNNISLVLFSKSTPISIRSCIFLRMSEVAVQEKHAASLSIYSHKELPKSCYNIEIVASEDNTDVYIICLPMIVKSYVPSLDKMPEFLLNLATQVKNYILLYHADLVRMVLTK
jgi:hypothetical protein